MLVHSAGRGRITAQGRATALSPVVILLPTLNEKEGVRATIHDIPTQALWEAGFDPEVVVIDGRSTDGTPEIAASLGATVLHQQSKGKGAAVREGMEWARSRGVPYVIVMDADFTYPGDALPTISTLLAAGSELAIGVRRPDRHAMSELRGLVHRLGNGVLNFLAGYLSRGTILDVCSGLWGVRTSALPQLALVSEGFDIEAEAFVKAFRLGLSVSQIPVIYRERVGIAKLHAFQDGARILLSILRYSRAPQAPGGVVGDPEPAGVGPLPPQTVRDLQSVLFALNNQRVFISAAHPRSTPVDALVDQLRGSAPDLSVEVVPTGIAPSSEPRARPTPDAAVSGAWSLVITLPEGPLRRYGQSCRIHIPEGERKVYLDLAPPAAADALSPDPNGLARSRAFRLERSSDRGFSSLRFLSSSLAQFPVQRDLAMIEANVAHSPYTVYRERPGLPAEPFEVPATPHAPVLADGATTPQPEE